MILALLVLAAPALADEAPKHKPNRLDKYVQSHYYEKKLFNTATTQAVQKISCPVPNFQIKRKSLKVLKPVSFSKDFHPTKGIWYENTNVVMCGKFVPVIVTIFANEDKEPTFATEIVER